MKPRRKQNIEPGLWQVPPPGQRALFPIISGFCELRKGQLILRDLAWGRRDLPEREVIAAMVDLYREGVRFIADGPLLLNSKF